MDENTNTAFDTEDELDAILPVGYADGDDFFNPTSWTGTGSTDSATEETTETTPIEENSVETDETTAPAIEQDANSDAAETSEVTATDVPAIEQNTDTTATSSKRKVTYQFDHRDVEQEIDLDTELPEILQKARSLDRYKDRLAQMQQKLDKYEATAKVMGHSNGEEFLNQIIETARKSERDDLVSKGTAPALVEDYINRKYPTVAQEPAKETEVGTEQPKSGERDFAQESRELLTAHPELRNQQLPQEVFDDAVVNNHTLLEAYRGYKAKADKAEQEKLLAAEKARADKAEKENRILKQNAASAERAPVTGVTKGGSTQQKADDPFLKGFLSEDW